MSFTHPFEIIVIGSGPAGQKAAVQGAKAGKQVAIIECEPEVGGACVHRGTIPSKTLRECALDMARLKLRSHVFDFALREDLQVQSLTSRMHKVIETHSSFMKEQLTRNGITQYHGRAQFTSDRTIDVIGVDGYRQSLSTDFTVIATGSVPRTPEDIPIDHEHILDSDSILSMIYLPRSLTVLGGGVIASEYASIFALLGVEVTIVDKAERPLAFMDPELTDHFLRAFEEQGGNYRGQEKIREVTWDGFSKIQTQLESGGTVESEKMLVALGRIANLAGLQIEVAGLATNSRGLLKVDEHFQTSVPRIYAVGDIIGPPGLASTAMEQGRRAVRHALGMHPGCSSDTIPIGIYTIPEMASVGLTEEQARKRYGQVRVGRAPFREVARAQVSGLHHGLLKMIADGEGRKLLGVQIVGDGAIELIHVAQMGLLGESEVDIFVENIFNFPTLAEAYRVAALNVSNQMSRCSGQVRPPKMVDQGSI